MPGTKASTAYHFPIGKNVPVMQERSFHSDLARLVTFAKQPSLLGPAAFYKAGNVATRVVNDELGIASGVKDVIETIGGFFDR